MTAGQIACGTAVLIGVLVGLYIVSASSVSGKSGTNIDGCGTERPQFG